MTASPQQTWTQAKRLLCVRLDSLGDVLMVTPAIRALKVSVPGREITLLTSPSGAASRLAALVVQNVGRDGVLAMRRHGHSWLGSSGAASARRLRR